MSSQQQPQNEASKITAIKDQAVGVMKETLGNVLGNNKMELEGKAQKVHGKIEYQFAKAYKEGETEPEKFQKAYHPQEPFEKESVQQQPLPPAPIAGQAPAEHFSQNSPATEPSEMSAWKNQAVGSMKENWGNVTNNPQMEMEGKAQNLHGHNEAEFAKANKEGWQEPQHFEHGTKTTEHAQGTIESEKPSTMSAMKDKTLGTLKENWGSATGNTNTELAGIAQKMHGRNEAEFVKAEKQGLNEPEHFEHGRKSSEHAEGEVVGQDPSRMSGWKDQAVGAMKSTLGSATNNPNMELKGKAQQIHGKNEAEFAKAQSQGLAEPEHFGQRSTPIEHAEGKVEGQNVTKLGAIKDKAMGSIKETFGSMTGNQNMELKGKAQNIHGKNEAEFVKAQKHGLSEPEHFAHGRKVSAEGEVVSEEPSKMSGWKDQAVGTMKSTLGSATNNQDMELKGKAQQMHGKNETEFAKAQSQGLAEPEHFGQGLKTTEHAQGTIESDKPSTMSAMKDKTLGTLKENWGSATGNTNTELAGKAQLMHGRNEAEFVKAEKQGLNEPEHFEHGRKIPAEGEVVSEDPSKMSGWKDQAVGSVKESFGSMTNNPKMELEGKAQKFQGSNACTQADIKKNTINA